MFSQRESHSKISNRMISEVFYSQILTDMNGGSLYTRRFKRLYTSPFIDTCELKLALRGA